MNVRRRHIARWRAAVAAVLAVALFGLTGPSPVAAGGPARYYLALGDSLAASEQRGIWLWDLRTREVRWNHRTSGWPLSLGFSPDGLMLVAPADNDVLPTRLAQLDNLTERIFLHQHGTGEDHVRPFDIRRLQPLNVHIYQTPLPGAREQGGNRQQAERWKCRAFSFERERMAETPVGFGKLRIDK